MNLKKKNIETGTPKNAQIICTRSFMTDKTKKIDQNQMKLHVLQLTDMTKCNEMSTYFIFLFVEIAISLILLANLNNKFRQMNINLQFTAGFLVYENIFEEMSAYTTTHPKNAISSRCINNIELHLP